MNRGRQGSSIGGYTVVETLIFLAVTSFIFIAAVMLISGRQARAQFQSGVRGFETRLADVANDVATGYYRNSGATKECSEGASGPQFSAVNTNLGTNQNCVFVGTVIKLGDGGNRESFLQFTMAGLRQSGGESVTSLAQAKPQVLEDGAGFASIPIGAGIQVSCIAVEGVNAGACLTQNAAIGFFSSFEGATLTGEGGGSVQADVINYGPLLTLNHTETTAKSALNGFTGYDSANLNRQITICLVGGANQYALVKLGGNSSSSLAVTSEIKEGNSCV
jgi:hypothetical protein